LSTPEQTFTITIILGYCL